MVYTVFQRYKGELTLGALKCFSRPMFNRLSFQLSETVAILLAPDGSIGPVVI